MSNLFVHRFWASFSLFKRRFCFIVGLWAILSLFFSSLSFAQNENSVKGDRKALLDIYEYTEGNHWRNNEGWGTDKPLYSWYGVRTNREGRVTYLNLRDNNLCGSLPESIGNLSKVMYFNVKQNLLISEIPFSIGNMTSLTHLLLNGRTFDLDGRSGYHPGKTGNGTGASERSNQIIGHIPKSIGNLRDLRYLEASGMGGEKIRNGMGYPNSLTGDIPKEIGNLRYLKGLELSFNSLESIPQSIQNLSELIHLGLIGNRLANHGFPQELTSLTKLQSIWMGENNLGGRLPDLNRLKNLKILILSFNDLEGGVPDYLFDGTMPNINMVNLSWNKLSGVLPEFGQPNNLKALQVYGNNLSGTIPASIVNIPKMINLGLGWNNFEGEIPDLSHMYQLRFVDANDNQFTGPPPMVNTSNGKLKFLNFSNNQMSGEVPKDLSKLANLPEFKEIDLRNNNFSDFDLQPLIKELTRMGKAELLRRH